MAAEKGGVEDSQRYKDAMAALSSAVSSYSLLYEFPTSKTPRKKKAAVKSEKEVVVSASSAAINKNLESFPRNVRFLLVTGMLDGAVVHYRSASTQTELLRGIINGTGYLCGCKACNNSKVVNAYEFESHASCKTSHPNNHIHLENGKSLHQLVQDLKNAPPTELCDLIQALTGSSLNQKSFSSWKGSYEAALKPQPAEQNTKIVM